MPSLTVLAASIALAIATWHFLWRYLVNKSTADETAVFDLERFIKLQENQRDDTVKNRRPLGTCVIAGGGMAGCIAGAIMTRHFEQVIIVEQADTMAKLRERTMQYDQLHVFGAIVAEALQAIWPERFLQKVREKGGRYAAARERTFHLQLGAYDLTWDETIGKLGPTGIDTLMLSRPQMQSILVELTKEDTPGLRYMYGKVEGAVFSKDDRSITSVMVKTSKGETVEVPCDLVLDCSGPSRVHRRLIAGKTSFASPMTQSYKTNVAYATATIEVHPNIAKQLPIPVEHHSPGATWQDAGVVFMCSSLLTGHRNNALMTHSDGNKYYIATTCYNADKSDMALTLQNFREKVKLAYMESTGKEMDPWFDETMDLLLENEEMTNEKVKFYLAKDLESYTCQIDNRDRKLPTNLTLIGDSYCKLNPTYGQGTQKAVTEALTLSTSLEKHKGDIPAAIKYFDKKRSVKTFALYDFNRTLDLGCWEIQNINKDLMDAGVGKLERAFIKPLLTYMTKYRDVQKMNTFIQVIIGAKGSLTLMHPNMLFAAFWATLFL